MNLPDPPEEDQKPESKADEPPKTVDGPEQKLRFGFYREKTIHPPFATGRKPASLAGGQSAPIGAEKRQTGGIPLPRLNILPARPPEPALHPEDQPDGPFRSPGEKVPASPGDKNNPGRRLHAFEAAARKTQPAKIPWKYRLLPTREATHRAYWDVAATFSLIVNIILVCILIIMALQIRNLKTTMNELNTLGNNMLGGLYGNFVKMDQASINTTITMDAQVPLNFNLPVSQNTTVVLTSNVAIPNAHVVINTGGLAINSQASVTLPAGTTLPIALNLTIPFQSTIPISLKVPVSIPLSQTGLHDPLTGLQATVRPLYCMLNKNAQYPEGTYICAEHDAPTAGTP